MLVQRQIGKRFTRLIRSALRLSSRGKRLGYDMRAADPSLNNWLQFRVDMSRGGPAHSGKP